MVSRQKKIALWWGRAGLQLRAMLFLLAALVLSLLVYSQRPREDVEFAGSNFLVFILVNLNIAILLVLAFLVARNVVKLIFDRRRNLLGSRLKSRLVIAFVGLTLVPSVILFVVASGLLSRAMEGWFSSQVEASVSGAVDVAHHHYRSMESLTRSIGSQLAQELEERQSFLEYGPALEEFLERRRKEEGLYSVRILDQEGAIKVIVENAAASIEDFSEPAIDRTALQMAYEGSPSTKLEEKGSSQFVRAYFPVSVRGEGAVLLVSYRLKPELTTALREVNESFREYEQLKLFRNPIRSGYILTLSMITMMILFSAIWFGFYIARELVVPIERLAEGTRAVASGNYDYQVRVTGDDELAFLVRSFNTMTRDLKDSRIVAERRRVYLEAILSNLVVGVVGLDSQLQVNSINEAARNLLQITYDNPVFGQHIKNVLQEKHWEEIHSLLESLQATNQKEPEEVQAQEIVLLSEGRDRRVLCTAGRVKSEAEELLGFVLLFDDVTELSKAQQMAAWREVARRIAHEIKNPLTPIQLSAQRLRKLLGQQDGAGPLLESTQTILENVDSIKRLANEFSQFARMPTAELTLSNLNMLVSEVVAPFADMHPNVVFQVIADSRIPDNHMDREQVRRMIINLIDNAVDALTVDGVVKEGARVVVKTKSDRENRMVAVEIADNGQGISEESKKRIFEPYFTTKDDGTGLGLAVVTSIISDHQGQIRVFDAEGGGSRFVVELPIEPGKTQQRRFASA